VRVWPLESGSFVSRYCRLSLRAVVLGHIDGFTLRSLLSYGMTSCGLVKRYHRLGEICGLLPPAAVEVAGSSETLILFSFFC
jgi:hypothetical protein